MSKIRDFFNQDCTDEQSLIAMGREYLHELERQGVGGIGGIRYQQFYLRKFVLFCHERAVENIIQVSRSIIDSYQHYLASQVKSDGKPYSASHRRHFLTTVSFFFKWLVKNKHLLHNPAGAIEMPKDPDQKIPHQLLNAQQVERILEQPDTSTVLGIRDRAILETLYSTGIYRREMRNLRISDVDFAQGIIKVRDGAKSREVPIGNRALKWIERYLSVRPSLLCGRAEDILFIKKPGYPLEAVGIMTRVSKYVRAAKVAKKGACRLLRGAMASLMLENGADVRYVQHMLGHADPDTTQRYNNTSIQNLLQVHARTHPAKLKPTKTAQIIRELETPE